MRPQFLVKFEKARFRANFEKPRMGEIGTQALPRRKLGLDAIEPPRHAFGHRENHLAAQRGGTVVDVIESGFARAFFIALDSRSTFFINANDGVALVPAALVLVDGHDPFGVGRARQKMERRGVVER